MVRVAIPCVGNLRFSRLLVATCHPDDGDGPGRHTIGARDRCRALCRRCPAARAGVHREETIHDTDGRRSAHVPGGNTSLGFYSFYDNVIGPEARRVFILKGGPGAGKSTFMTRIADRLVGMGFDAGVSSLLRRPRLRWMRWCFQARASPCSTARRPTSSTRSSPAWWMKSSISGNSETTTRCVPTEGTSCA